MQLRPLRDQIIVQPLEWRPSSIIHVAGNKRAALRGKVIAVGPGARVKKYWKNTQGQRIAMAETGQVIPTELQPGDIVELGGLELDGYKFQTIELDHQQYVVCQEADVAMVVTYETSWEPASPDFQPETA